MKALTFSLKERKSIMKKPLKFLTPLLSMAMLFTTVSTQIFADDTLVVDDAEKTTETSGEDNSIPVSETQTEVTENEGQQTETIETEEQQPEKYELGATVFADSNSPSGYTVQFAYDPTTDSRVSDNLDNITGVSVSGSFHLLSGSASLNEQSDHDLS